MRTTLTALAASLLLALPVYAEDAHHPDQKTDAVPAAKAPVAPAVRSQAVQPLQQMQANVKKMDTQLKRIAKEKNEAERNRLLGEHLQTMRANMRLAGGMASGCPMMGGGMMGPGMMGGGMGMMMGPGAGMMMGPGDMMERMQQMEKRMDMMQMMMEQRDKPPSAPTPEPAK
jgi:hypothetical protein